MGMSEFYGGTDEDQAIETIHRALDLGVNFFDTADMYGVGCNEKLVGKAFAGKRDQAVICTKFGVLRAEDGTRIGVSGTSNYVKMACDASLKRLGIDTIDLYYQHRVDWNVPIEETIGAMADLVKAGKIRHIGMSEAPPEIIRRAYAVHPITALQTEYSLWTRHVEEEILPLCRELGITFVAYSPLGRGMLTGKYQTRQDFEKSDWRLNNPRFSSENFEHNLEAVTVVNEIAAEKGITPAQLALAWVHAQGDDIVSIPGTKRRKYLEENVAAEGIKFTAEELERLEGIAGKVVGERY
jgi:aryl-alcohol dehydrogenase-like predicted oxidoreductase